MNIDNIDKAVKINNRIKANRKSLKNIENFLNNYPGGNSDGNSYSSEQKLYGLHISEYKDHSGKNDIDLTGSLIQIEVLEFAKEALEKRIEKDLALIEKL